VIYGFFIIDKKRGTSLVSRKYADFGINVEILPSFVSALWIFSEKELLKKGEVNEERLAGYKWIYSALGDILFLIIADPSDRTSWLKSNIELIKTEFLRKYPELAENQSKLEEWTLTPSKWTEFEKIVDEYLNIWTKIERNTEIAKIYDIVEIYQKIMSPLFNSLPEEVKVEFMKRYTQLVKKLDPTFNAHNFDFLLLQLDRFSYRRVKTFLKKTLFILVSIFNESLPEETRFEVLKRHIYPIVKSELKRLSTYKLFESLIPLLLP